MRTKSQRTNQRKARNYGAEADLVRAQWCLCNEGLCAEMRAIGEGDTDDVVARWCSGAIVAAHVVSRGAGGGRFDIVPLCTKHHDEQHRIGIESFAAMYGLDLRALADAIALAHELPQGIRGLAARWVDWRENYLVYMARLTTSPATDVPEPLEGYDLAALLGWTRRRMDAELAAYPNLDMSKAWAVLASVVAEDLAMEPGSTIGTPAWALCEQAGWPS